MITFPIPSFTKLDPYTRLPRDIGTLTNDQLLHLTRGKEPVDFILGGWECQMISAAGKLQGLNDPRFTYFFDLVHSTNYL